MRLPDGFHGWMLGLALLPLTALAQSSPTESGDRAELEAQIRLLEARVTALQRSEESWIEGMRRASEVERALKQRVAELEAGAAAVEAPAEAAEDEIGAVQLAALREERETLAQARAGLEASLGQRERENQALQARVAELEARLQTTAPAPSLEALRREREELRQARTGLEASLAVREAQISTLQARVAALEDNRVAPVADDPEAAAIRADLVARLAVREEQIEALQQRLKALQERQSQAPSAGDTDGQIERQDLLASRDRLQANLQELEQQLATLQQSRSSALEAVREARAAESALQAKVAELEQGLQQASAERAASTREARSQAGLEAERDRLQSEVQAQTHRLAEQAGQIAVLEEQQRAAQTALAALREQENQWQADRASGQQSEAARQQLSLDVAAARRAEQDLREQLTQLQAALAARDQALAQARLSAEQATAEVAAARAARDAALEQTRQVAEQAEQERREAGRTLAALQAERATPPARPAPAPAAALVPAPAPAPVPVINTLALPEPPASLPAQALDADTWRTRAPTRLHLTPDASGETVMTLSAGVTLRRHGRASEGDRWLAVSLPQSGIGGYVPVTSVEPITP